MKLKTSGSDQLCHKMHFHRLISTSCFRTPHTGRVGVPIWSDGRQKGNCLESLRRRPRRQCRFNFALTRSNDGQMMFLANLISKMKTQSTHGSRIAELHNGSSLFTGEAGQGESRIRQWIIENHWLEAIVALPINLFYNTNSATYIWVLSNKKHPSRRQQIQLINAVDWFEPLRKNFGKKNCILGPSDIQRICDTFLNANPEPTDFAQMLRAEDFGYWSIVVDRPLRLRLDLSIEDRQRFQLECEASNNTALSQLLDQHVAAIEYIPSDFNSFQDAFSAISLQHGLKLTSRHKATLYQLGHTRPIG